jgi:hypothetical protein
MVGTSPGDKRTVLQTNGRPRIRWWLVVLVAGALVVCCYLYLALWFVVHQREYQYTAGGTSGSPEAVGLEDFAEVSVATEDGEPARVVR